MKTPPSRARQVTSAALTKSKKIGLRWLHATTAFVLSALVWVLASAVLGASAVTYGVQILAGDGWAFISAGVFLIAFSAYVRWGLIRGQ